MHSTMPVPLRLCALCAFARHFFRMPKQTQQSGSDFCETLRSAAARYEVSLGPNEIRRLSDYYELLQSWNPRLHLVAPCAPAEFATRHVLESLLLLPHLREDARIADIGSGAGLPIIPNLIARPDLQATLIEASKKKSVFLREALRETQTSAQAHVVAERFENVPTPAVDYVTCRALDRFGAMLPKIVERSPPESKLLLFGSDELGRQLENCGLQ